MDHEDEESDLNSHAVSGDHNEGNRSEREGTPGPEPTKESGEQSRTEAAPSATESSESTIKQAADEVPKKAAE